MMRQFTFLSFIIALSVFSLVSGCSEKLAADTEKMVFYCTETREIVVADRQSTPAVHPNTGRKTLQQALYCKTCGKWQAAPPLEQLGGNPSNVVCGKHKIPLQADGPLPDTSGGRGD
jgi:hypothetical protein